MKPAKPESRSPGKADVKVQETQSRRDRIIQAAAICFDLYSIQRTTIDDIVKKSGCSRPTIYREFSNKEEIVQCVAINAARDITRAVQSAIASVTSSRERIVTAILTSVEFQTSSRWAHDGFSRDFRLVLTRPHSEKAVVETVTERWAPILSAAIADGTMRSDLDMDETVIWLTDLTILLAARYLAQNESLEDTRREIERFVLDGLCARP